MELGQLNTTGETIHIPDLTRHLYAIGASGVGKTSFLENLMRQDLDAGRGFCFLDPHGDSSQKIADAIPKHRIQDVIYLDPADLSASPSLNLFENIQPDDRPLVAAQIVACFKGIYGSSWGPRMEYILTNSLRLLLDSQGERNRPCETLLGLPRLLTDSTYRGRLIDRSNDPLVKRYWDDEFSKYDKRFLNEAISPIQNKIGAVLMPPAIRHLLGQPTSTIDLAHIMDTSKILIVNLSKGRLGDEPAHLLGALLISAIHQAAQSRSGIAEGDRRPFSLYVDEFQNFATSSFTTILSEARKWKLSLVLAHQFASQTPEEIFDAVITNVGTMVSFRISDKDARLVAPEMGLESKKLLTQLADHKARVKRILEDGNTTDAELMKTFPPEPGLGSFDAVRANTLSRYARPRSVVEAHITRALS
jgi:hypothetical protein